MRAVIYSVSIVLLGLLPLTIFAGDLDSPAGPSDPASAMYTIEDLYDYLDTGVAGPKRSGGFTEPVSGPGSSGRTLDEVHAKITEKCITCAGTLNGTRWCDQGDGTVKDMITGLVWLKNASWGGSYAFWVNTMNGTNAHDRAARLEDGVGGLTDGSVEGAWRLPTKTELYNLANGTERIRCPYPGPCNVNGFTGVQTNYYWSSTTDASYTSNAWIVYMGTGNVGSHPKGNGYYVWPVRSGN